RRLAKHRRHLVPVAWRRPAAAFGPERRVPRAQSRSRRARPPDRAGRGLVRPRFAPWSGGRDARRSGLGRPRRALTALPRRAVSARRWLPPLDRDRGGRRVARVPFDVAPVTAVVDAASTDTPKRLRIQRARHDGISTGPGANTARRSTEKVSHTREPGVRIPPGMSASLTVTGPTSVSTMYSATAPR